MVLTEQGLHCAKDCDRWRCVEWPGLTVGGDRHEVEGRPRAAQSHPLRQ